MSTNALRSFQIEINWGRALMALALIAFFAIAMVEPAYAFEQFESKVTERTNQAADVIRNVLLVAAVVALLVGIAPMLWGQVKVKWMVTSLIACVLFGLAGTLVEAFKA